MPSSRRRLRLAVVDGSRKSRHPSAGDPAGPILRRTGLGFPSLRANLALVGKSFESFLATKLLLAVFGLLLGPFLLAALTLGGVHLPFVVPVWAGLLLALVFFFLPDIELKQRVDKRRRDFRHAIGAFLDLVAMNLAGGRGVPEALMSASEIGTGWAMWRIRDALTNARIIGQTPWQALGALGEEVRIDELRDLSAALSLVAEDGAKVRESRPPGPRACGAGNWPNCRGRRGRGPSRCWSRRCCSPAPFYLPHLPGGPGHARILTGGRRCEHGRLKEKN